MTSKGAGQGAEARRTIVNETSDLIRKGRKPPKPGSHAFKRREKVGRLLIQGKTVDRATASAGVRPGTYYDWRKVDPGWAAELDRKRNQVRGKIEYPVEPFDEDFRERYYGGDYEEPVNPRHIRVMMDFVNRLTPGQFGISLLPPEHAKTSMGEDWLGHEIAVYSETRSVVLSKTQPEAKKRLLKIQARMEDEDFYSDYIDTYGPFKPEGRDQRPWSATVFSVLRKTPRQRDYSCQARGIGGQIQGARIDRLLADDIADDQNQSPQDVDNQARYLRVSVNTRLGKTGIGWMIGTRQIENDIYGKLMDEEFFDAILILPAVFEEDFEYVMADGEVISWHAGEGLWPERYSDDDYDTMRRKAGPEIWDLTYQQKSTVSAGRKFPLDLIKTCFDESLEAQRLPNGYISIGGIDVSAVNFTAGCAYAVNPKTRHRIIMDMWNEKGLVGDGGEILPGLVQFILELVRKYRMRSITLENNSAFVIVSSSLSLKSGLTDLNCRLRTVQSGKGELDDFAIEQLSILFVNKILAIPHAGSAKGLFSPFIHQLSSFRAGDKKFIKDMIKAWQFAEDGARNLFREIENDRPEVEENLPPYLRRQLKTVRV